MDGPACGAPTTWPSQVWRHPYRPLLDGPVMHGPHGGDAVPTVAFLAIDCHGDCTYLWASKGFSAQVGAPIRAPGGLPSHSRGARSRPGQGSCHGQATPTSHSALKCVTSTVTILSGQVVFSGLGWAALGWAGLGWAGAGAGCAAPRSAAQRSAALRCAGLGWAGLGWAGLGWAGLAAGWVGWAGLGGLGWAAWAGLGCLFCSELGWADAGGLRMRTYVRTHMNFVVLPCRRASEHMACVRTHRSVYVRTPFPSTVPKHTYVPAPM